MGPSASARQPDVEADIPPSCQPSTGRTRARTPPATSSTKLRRSAGVFSASSVSEFRDKRRREAGSPRSRRILEEKGTGRSRSPSGSRAPGRLAASAVSRFALLLDRVLLVFELVFQAVTGRRIVSVRLLHPLYLGFDGVLLALQLGAQGSDVGGRRGRGGGRVGRRCRFGRWARRRWLGGGRRGVWRWRHGREWGCRRVRAGRRLDGRRQGGRRAESTGAGSDGSGRGADVAAGVEAGAAVAVELGTTTSSSTVAGSAVVGTSSSRAAVVGTADVESAGRGRLSEGPSSSGDGRRGRRRRRRRRPIPRTAQARALPQRDQDEQGHQLDGDDGPPDRPAGRPVERPPGMRSLADVYAPVLPHGPHPLTHEGAVRAKMRVRPPRCHPPWGEGSRPDLPQLRSSGRAISRSSALRIFTPLAPSTVGKDSTTTTRRGTL